MVMKEFVLSHDALRSAHWRPFAGSDGVRYTVLWRDPDGGSYAGLLRLDPGATLPAHRHDAASHHLFVVHGMCFVAGEPLGPESYMHVDAGETHVIEHAGPQGCTIFYLYLVGGG